MADKKVNIKITADSKEAKKGIDGISESINKLANKARKNPLTKLGTSVKNLIPLFSTASKAVGAVVDAVESCANAYKTQAKAEKQLEQAAKNNPYLDDTSVKQLKQYASELQKISTVGDEQLIPMMAQLASTGRNQAEIQDIMATALDVSASGAMSLEQAVSSLNATYSGSLGTLGRQNAELKTLTKEELESGKAVQILGQKYKGMAKEVSDATGSSEQLKNAWGDLLEVIGAPAEKIFSTIRKSLQGMIEGITQFLTVHNKYKTAMQNMEEGTESVEDVTVLLNKKITDLRNTQMLLNQELKESNGVETSISRQYQNQINKLNSEIKLLNDKKRTLEMQAKVEKEQRAIEASNSTKTNEELETQKTRREELRKEYQASLDATEREIDATERAGKALSEEEKAQLRYNAAYNAYVKMYSDPAFDRSQTTTGMWAGEAEQIEYVSDCWDKLTEEQKKAAVSYDGLSGIIDKFNTETVEDQMKSLEEDKEKLEALLANGSLDEFPDKADKVRKAIEGITQAIDDLNNASGEELLKSISGVIDTVNNFASQYSTVMNNIASVVTQQAENEASVRTAALEKQYSEGLISEEEYQEKKEQIEKDAAQKEYEIEMWQWSASIVQAQASMAQAMVSTLANENGPAALKIAMMALIGAAGSAQLAAIISAKPVPPSFATGGIVGGESYYGDKVSANVNSGEMILNRNQQRALFDSINNGSIASGSGNNVKIYNNNAKDNDVTADITEDGINILIDKRVNKSMGKGTYNKSMIEAQNSFRGLRISN